MRKRRKFNPYIWMETGVLGGGGLMPEQQFNARLKKTQPRLLWRPTAAGVTSNVVPDLMGNHNGTLAGTATYNDGEYGSELVTDADTTRITPVGDIYASGRAEFALMLFYRADGLGEGTARLYEDGPVLVYHNSGTITASIATSGGTRILSGHALNFGEYAVMLLTVKDSTYTLYEATNANDYQLTQVAQNSTAAPAVNDATGVIFLNNAAAGRAFDGALYAAAKYDTVPQIADIQAAIDALNIKQIIYVDTATGSDSDSGLTTALAKATLTNAISAVIAAGGDTVRVTAAESTPLREQITYTASKDITIKGYADADWYHYASTQYTSGWAADGGGVYSRVVTGSWPTVLTNIRVSDITDGNGQWLRLIPNASTPTTPSAGEFGWVNATKTLYVHMPDSDDANGYTIEASNWYWCISAQGNNSITIKNGIFRGGTSSVVEARGGHLRAEDCTLEYSMNGVAAAYGYSTVVATTCLSRWNTNDGFNLHAYEGVASTMTLNTCEGAYNGDEGASPHDDTRMFVTGGRYHHNGEAGITAINNARITLTDVTSDNNGQNGTAAIANRGGIVIYGNVSGFAIDCTVEDNTGEGFYCDTTGTFVVTNLTSTGNTVADVLCS